MQTKRFAMELGLYVLVIIRNGTHAATAEEHAARLERELGQSAAHLLVIRVGVDGARHPVAGNLLAVIRNRGRAGLCDVVLVDDLTRIGRRIDHLLEFIEALAEAGNRFVCRAESIDTTDPDWRRAVIEAQFARLDKGERDPPESVW